MFWSAVTFYFEIIVPCSFLFIVVMIPDELLRMINPGDRDE